MNTINSLIFEGPNTTHLKPCSKPISNVMAMEALSSAEIMSSNVCFQQLSWDPAVSAQFPQTSTISLAYPYTQSNVCGLQPPTHLMGHTSALSSWLFCQWPRLSCVARRQPPTGMFSTHAILIYFGKSYLHLQYILSYLMSHPGTQGKTC